MILRTNSFRVSPTRSRLYHANLTFHIFPRTEEAMDNLKKDAMNKQIKISSQNLTAKPYRLTDYNRDTLLSGKLDEDQDSTGTDEEFSNSNQLTYVEEQEKLKDEFKDAISKQFQLESGEDNLLEPVEKSPEESQRENEEYRKWLLENLKADDGSRKAFHDWIELQECSAKREIGSENTSKNIDSNEKFLMNYIFNRGWVDPLDKQLDNSIQSNNIHKSTPDLSRDSWSSHEQSSIPTLTEQDMEDFEREETFDEFETNYNFRFEELDQKYGPGSSYGPLAKSSMIPTYSRSQPDSVRRKETKRSEARKLKEERKRSEKNEKLSELRRMKSLKKKEMEETVTKIKDTAGLENEKVDVIESILNEELDNADFDPDKWDDVMNKIFDDEYYEQADKKKPKFESDSEEIPEFNSNSEERQNGRSHQERENTESLRNQVEEEAERLKRLAEEYDSLNYEDILDGSIKTRFKYRKVEKDDFGLKPDVILQADDDLLNEYVSLKKLAPYRTGERHERWMSKWSKSKKKRRKEFMNKLKSRLAVD